MIELENNIGTLETSPAFAPISRVTLIVGTDENGDEISYTAGNDTGRTLTAKCPWATQAIANELVAGLGGFVYQPFTAGDALLDPAAELGDEVSVGGVTSLLGSIATTFDALYTADVEAPQDEEIDHEYPYEPSAERTAARKEATITAELRVMGDTISSKVSSDDAQTMITQSINGITLSAVAGSNQSTLTITADGITAKTAVVRFNNIVADSIAANASISSPSIYGGKYYNAQSTSPAYMAMLNSGFPSWGLYYNNGTPKFRISDESGPNSTLNFIYETSIIATAASGGVTFPKNLVAGGAIILTEGQNYGTLAQRDAQTATAGRLFFVRK